MGVRTLLKAKLKALLLHFGLSVLIFLPFVYLIWFNWYPEPLFFTDGGWQGLRIMALVDLVLGPSLTFLIFNPAKTRRALGFDFLCIGLAQATALVYGIHTVQLARPWVLAYHDGALHVLTSEAYADQQVEPGTWERLGKGPMYRVYARDPRNEDEEAGVVTFGALAGLGPEGLSFLYEPMDAHLASIKARALDMPRLTAGDAALRADYEALLARHPDDALWFLPLYGYFSSAIAALDAEGQLAGALYREPPAIVPQEEATP